MEQDIVNIEHRISDFYEILSITQNSIVWVAIIFIFVISFFFFLDYHRRKELQFNLYESRTILKSLKKKSREIDQYKPIMHKIFSEIILTTQLSYKFVELNKSIDSDRQSKIRSTIKNKYRLILEHLKTVSIDENQNMQALHQLFEDGNDTSLEFLRHLESHLKRKKYQKQEYDDLHIMLSKTIEEINFRIRNEN